LSNERDCIHAPKFHRRSAYEYEARKARKISLDVPTALKKQQFDLVFVDAFAGTGEIPTSSSSNKNLFDMASFIDGSAKRALSLETPFDRYLFIEKSLQKCSELNELKMAFAHLARRIDIRNTDSNAGIAKFCETTDWRRTRAVVFLDPFGNQVKFSTLELMAGTNAIDLWYLFPAGLGVHRQIRRDGKIDESHRASLDALFGETDWESRLVSKFAEQDLLGLTIQSEKIATPNTITKYMIERMKSIFKGGVLDEWLPLGARKVHMYSLLFAWANPREKAKLAGKLAAAVMQGGGRGRSQ
jgi:three-Cys-motif partner protein